MRRRGLLVLPILTVVLVSLVAVGPTQGQAGAPAEGLDGPKTAWRRPSALALTEDGKWLFAANRRSGSLSVIDATAPRLVAEVAVGRGLSDLVLTPDGDHLLAVDEAGDELVILRRRGPDLDPIHRLRVGPGPITVRISTDGSRGFVASLWSRRLIVVDLDPIVKRREVGRGPRILATIELPFAPRTQLWIPDAGRLVVADAFGGRLAVMDVDRGEVESVRTLPAHNIRGLALSPDRHRLLMTHQLLSSRATTSLDDIHWGNLITNNLRSLSMEAVLNPTADLLRDSDLDHLGDVGHGAGDPAGVAVGPDGSILIALGGIGEIAARLPAGGDWRYFAVGRRPTAVVARPDGLRAYVANTFDDSIAVVDPNKGRVVAKIALGPSPEPSPSDRGELLFYDARLAHEGWLSCHSCHSDGHTNGLLADTLSDGTVGTPKRVLSLLGVKDTGPWAWNGGAPDLETQIRKSVRLTMQGSAPSERAVRDLSAFLQTLSPPPAPEPTGGPADREAVARGRDGFARLACGRCHTPPAYTSGRSYQVGVTDEVGNKDFNPPSLRGVGQADSFFHDNRAATLDEVFTRHRHQLPADLTTPECADLLSFLRSL